MQLTKQSDEKRARVSVYLITFIVLFVVAVALAGCNKNNNRNGNVTVGPSPSPSPSPSPVGSPGGTQMIPGDTIIVIKDGSVKMKVNKTLCTDDDDPSQPDDKKYKCNYEIGAVGIQTTGGPTCVTSTANDKITIDGGGGKEVEIKGTAATPGNPGKVSIKFKKAHYPQCAFGAPGEHCGTNHVGTIKVGSSFTKACDPDEKCELWVKKK